MASTVKLETPVSPPRTGPFAQPFTRVKRIGGYTFTNPSNRELYKNLRGSICSIDLPKLQDSEEVDVELTEFKAVAAYNWDDQKEPRILVPGHPRIWHDKPLPFQISKDTEQVFVDQNSGRLAASPLLPLIIAVHHHDPRFRMGEMDFITDRNGLRKLYRWANQSSWSQTGPTRTFRIDVELVGKTILLQRWEANSTQNGGPGYEKNFQKHTTSQIPETINTTGHHRVVTYKFGDKRILMRYTTDACLPPERDSVDELTSKLISLNLQKALSTRKIATFKRGFLSVQTVGKLVPQESIIELKTKGQLGLPANFADLYVQLSFAGISNVYTGRHEWGTFHSVEKETLSDVKEKAGEMVLERSLKLLKKTLDEIQRIVFENLEDGGSLSLVLRKGAGGLDVFQREGRDGLLPENILAFIN